MDTPYMHPYVTKFWLPETYLTFRGGDKREEKKLLIKIKIRTKYLKIIILSQTFI